MPTETAAPLCRLCNKFPGTKAHGTLLLCERCHGGVTLGRAVAKVAAEGRPSAAALQDVIDEMKERTGVQQLKIKRNRFRAVIAWMEAQHEAAEQQEEDGRQTELEAARELRANQAMHDNSR